MAQNNNNNNSPHLSDTGLPASAAPAMSNGQQQQGDSRQSYPNPNDFPSQSQYAYPPPNQGAEPYRASPTGSNGSLNLPSLRTLDSLQQQQQQQHMAPPAPMGGSPYYHNQVQSLPHPGYPNVTSDPQGQNMRYALPAGDQRIMSGGRHKKEIKRRTKTGCLTCRKRRIKCDEGQPACRNCQKSKRDCQGYDPIFKQQPGPAAIQPAPSSGPSQGSVPATAHSYGLQPQMMQGYGAQGNMNYDPALSAAASSPNSAQPYDYASAIDPALEAVSAAPIPPPIYSVPAKRAIDDLFARHGDPPAAPLIDPSQSPADIEEAKHLYYSIYAPGLENFLETKWFTAKGGNKLVTSKDMLIQFAVLLKRFAATDAGIPKEMEITAGFEARIVWQLAKMVIAGAADIGNKQSGLVPTPDDPTEATQRLAVFEILLTGAVASTNALTQPVPGSTDHHRLRELEFWFTLGNFVCFPYEDSTSVKAIDDTLAALRNLLDGRENRDVLYSIAVVRALSHRVSEYNDTDTPLHFDENDNKSKLSIAKKFVGDEGEGAGTTNVIRRLCELATRSWAAPPAAPIVPKQEV